MISWSSSSTANTQRRAAVKSGSGDDLTRIKRQAWLLSSAALAGAILCGMLWFASRRSAGELSRRMARSDVIARDAQTIASARTKPRRAAETTLTKADLLERVSGAMRAASIDPRMLISTLPQPPRQLPGSRLAEVASRLVFEGISLRQLVDFGLALHSADEQLRLAGLRLRAAADKNTWHVDVTVSYLLVVIDAPRES